MSSRVDVDFLTNVLGPEVATSLTDAYEHHGDGPGDSPATSGTVLAIGAAFCRYMAQLGVDHCSRPEPGTAVIEPRSAADGWERETRQPNSGSSDSSMGG
ncbi:MAG: DUF6578 domain-containing protein [Acidimicrobiales bacterium]